MTSREEKADFTINSAPVDITFTCPHCRWQTDVPFEDVDEPECWQDDWGGERGVPALRRGSGVGGVEL